MDRVIGDNLATLYYHYPSIAAVVTASAAGRDNAMAVAWHMAISFKPPLYGVAISPKRFSYQLIASSREFGVNFLPHDKAELVASVGGSKGSEIDKFQQFSIARDHSLKTAVPILKTAYAAFECRLIDDRLYGDHRLLVGEIAAVHHLREAFMEDGTLDIAKVGPTLYLGNDHYMGTAECSVRTIDRTFCARCFKAGD